MNRLREYSGSGPVSERGIEMLRGTAATHTAPDMKRRVWSSLQRIGPEPTGLRMPGIKVLAIGVMVVSFAGTAGAVITGRWIVPALDRAQAAPAVPGPRLERRRPARRIAVAPLRDEAAAPVT